jgi:2-iminobutanoate/2-iminopropanoate deaminase
MDEHLRALNRAAMPCFARYPTLASVFIERGKIWFGTAIAPVVGGRRTGNVFRTRKMLKLARAAIGILTLTCGSALTQELSPNGVKTLAPTGAIKSTGTWNLGTRAGDFIYVAGMRGIDPKTDTLVQGEEARVRQAFLNMKLVAESEGATLRDAVRLVVYVTDMFRYRPIVNKIQTELWGQGPYPPRTIVEVDRLNQDDIVEIEGTFYSKMTGLTADQKEVLFREFMQWRARQKPGR